VEAALEVAPHAGAWIETEVFKKYSDLNRVAPHAGAWIETPPNQSNYTSACRSRPMRARGLKRACCRQGRWLRLSRPMRARGLKLTPEQKREFVIKSRPMRARGLKLVNAKYFLAEVPVAPHAGAWIETIPVFAPTHFKLVAPHAGAWIETHKGEQFHMFRRPSRPMRARGLKRLLEIDDDIIEVVAPHAGAWIETLTWHKNIIAHLSRPMRARGLKPVPTTSCHSSPAVAPHAGAWIETTPGEKQTCTGAVAPHAGAWIETVNNESSF